MSENNDTSNESNNLGIDSVLQTSRLNNIQVSRSGVLRPSVLGPSVLGSSLNKNSDCTNVQDAVKEKDIITNPFLKEVVEEEERSTNACVEKSNETQNISEDKKIHDEEDQDGHVNPLNLLRKNGLERANMFAAAKNSIPRVEKSGFVFGQNVHERVVGENINPETSGKADNDTSEASGEMLFSSVIKNVVKPSDSEGISSKDAEGTKSLNEVAREYEESRAQKRKFEEVETFTGEENEVNIVDINCKLFAFVNSNWEERGRGSLRLNDSKNEKECSRVVFRTAGNLRLLLNTKVWADMVAERPSQKSLRLTAMDNTGKIKIFLAMARPAEINLLHKALVERIDLRKVSDPAESDSIMSNVGDDTENGASKDMNSEVTQAASTADPDNEDLAEPSPKKPFPLDKDN